MEPSTENKPMNMPLIIGGIIFLLIILVLVFTSSKNSETSNSTNMEAKVVTTPIVTPSITPTPVETTKSMPSNVNAKVFTVTAANFSYDVKEIKVNKGDTVKIVFKNSEGFHDFVIDEFGVKTSKLNVGGEETLQFVADKTGSFVYYCSVGQHRAMGMVGTLSVQ